MSDAKDYSPIASLRRLRGDMQSAISKAGERVIPGTEVAAPIAVVQRAAPCCVLLKMLTDGGPVPDDFTRLTSSSALRDHVRSDGAVYLGAFEVQGKPDSVVLVYGDPSMPVANAERLASLERPSLERRYADWQLGIFASAPVVLSPSQVN
jgi:hypothetical protein